MLEAADAIAQYCSRGRQAFANDSTIRDAILYQMVILGEAAKAVVNADALLADELSEVEWSLLAKLRDRLTHHYWTTDREIVWSTATQDIPTLRTTLSSALERIS